MPQPDNNKTNCPHCGVPFFPVWNPAQINTRNPQRTGEVSVWQLWTTTCTSCEKPIAQLQAIGATAETMPEWDIEQVCPMPPEVAIEIIIQIFIDFDRLHRRQEREPDMTEEEEKEKRKSFREFFTTVMNAVKTGGDAAQIFKNYLPFFEQLRKLLPPSEGGNG